MKKNEDNKEKDLSYHEKGNEIFEIEFLIDMFWLIFDGNLRDNFNSLMSKIKLWIILG